jgi:hypothetical protein
MFSSMPNLARTSNILSMGTLCVRVLARHSLLTNVWTILLYRAAGTSVSDQIDSVTNAMRHDSNNNTTVHTESRLGSQPQMDSTNGLQPAWLANSLKGNAPIDQRPCKNMMDDTETYVTVSIAQQETGRSQSKNKRTFKS